MAPNLPGSEVSTWDLIGLIIVEFEADWGIIINIKSVHRIFRLPIAELRQHARVHDLRPSDPLLPVPVRPGLSSAQFPSPQNSPPLAFHEFH